MQRSNRRQATFTSCGAIVGVVMTIVFLFMHGVYNVGAVSETGGDPGRLGGEFERVLPASVYGGIWIDDDGMITVGIIGGEEVIANYQETIHREAAASGFSETRIQSVRNPWQTLRQTNEAINQLHQKNVDYRNGEWPIQMGIRTDLNKIQVDIPPEEHLTDGHRVVLREIEEKYKDIVIILTYDNLPTPEAGDDNDESSAGGWQSVSMSMWILIGTVMVATGCAAYFWRKERQG